MNTAKWRFDGYISDAPLSVQHSKSFDYGTDTTDGPMKSSKVYVNEFAAPHSRAKSVDQAIQAVIKEPEKAGVKPPPIVTKHSESQTSPPPKTKVSFQGFLNLK